MVGKTAAAVSLPLEQEAEPRHRRVVKKRIKRRVGPLAAYGLFTAAAVVLVLLYVAQYALVAQLNLRLAQAEKDLARATVLQERLEQEASELRSLTRIEREAIERLGMSKPEEVKVVKAELPAPAPKTQVQAPPAETRGQTDKLAALLNWVQGLRQALAKGLTEVQ